MRRILMVLAIGSAVATGCGDRGATREAPATARGQGEDWMLEPGTRAGALDRHGSEPDVAKVYGAQNVRDTLVALGEGETARGTILYPEDPLRRLEILWADAVAKRDPARVILRGERSRWTLPRGVSLGTSLAELEEKNGRPFQLAGFGWDYAGAVTSWQGGPLDSLLAPGVHLYLLPRAEQRSGPDYSRLQGDRDFLSSHPAMRALNPRVYQIFLDFEAASPGAPAMGGD